MAFLTSLSHYTHNWEDWILLGWESESIRQLHTPLSWRILFSSSLNIPSGALYSQVIRWAIGEFPIGSEAIVIWGYSQDDGHDHSWYPWEMRKHQSHGILVTQVWKRLEITFYLIQVADWWAVWQTLLLLLLGTRLDLSQPALQLGVCGHVTRLWPMGYWQKCSALPPCLSHRNFL